MGQAQSDAIGAQNNPQTSLNCKSANARDFGISPKPQALALSLFLLSVVAQHVADRNGRAVVPGGNLDSALLAGRVDDLAVADVHGNVVDRAAAVGVEDPIAGTHLAGLHRRHLARPGLRSNAAGHAELPHHLHGEAGAVRAPVRLVRVPPHVGDSRTEGRLTTLERLDAAAFAASSAGEN